MKIKIPTTKEIEVKYIRLILPVRYEEEDIPNDFPLRRGDVWEADVELDTGKILNWQLGKEGKIEMKVCDGGVYVLLGPNMEELARREYYVPSFIPGDYGDYVDLNINKDGFITNWLKNPDLSVFFVEEED